MIRCEYTAASWPMLEPFEISREVITHQPVLLISLIDGDGNVGRAEAAGVDYAGETPQSIAQQIAGVREQLQDDLSGQALLDMLPAGGARNALDCALWDLRAKQSGVPVWKTAGLAALKPVVTDFTLGLGDEATTRRKAREARKFPLLKLKVDAKRHLDAVRVVRQEHPTARLVVDANQSWSLKLLKELIPELQALGVELIEQPLPAGADGELEQLHCPIPLAADESCTDRASLANLLGRYQFINIKLDKCGGLTEGFALADQARALGFGLMVGNMCGSSLAMAPAFMLAQQCSYVDLDGPLLQKTDCEHPMVYVNGVIHPPLPALWG